VQIANKVGLQKKNLVKEFQNKGETTIAEEWCVET
jgi:DNA-binding phage protein